MTCATNAPLKCKHPFEFLVIDRDKQFPNKKHLSSLSNQLGTSRCYIPSFKANNISISVSTTRTQRYLTAAGGNSKNVQVFGITLDMPPKLASFACFRYGTSKTKRPKNLSSSIASECLGVQVSGILPLTPCPIPRENAPNSQVTRLLQQTEFSSLTT